MAESTKASGNFYIKDFEGVDLPVSVNCIVGDKLLSVGTEDAATVRVQL